MARSIPRSSSANDVERHAFAPRWGRVGDAYDDAMAESFFATLECELLDRRRFRDAGRSAHGRLRISSRASTIRARRHSSLGYPVSQRVQIPICSHRCSNPVHTSMPSCSRPSRSGTGNTTASCTASVPSRALTATRHDGLGTCRHGRKYALSRTKRFTERGGQNAVKPDTLIPRPHLSTKPGLLHNMRRAHTCHWTRMRRSRAPSRPLVA